MPGPGERNTPPSDPALNGSFERAPGTTAAYQVLARKYRPATFADLIGQEAMVRTLTNALHSGRLAHAFMLTGVRGVGKTTTARIIARALNCIGPDGQGGPTPEPCGACEHCRTIAEDRHVDVLEMDAASRAGGIEDVRELIDGVRYRPTSARYKVYIIDEIHMMSKPAFNALLKTLEEPPPHVKFIFATTEIRKVPVTVLSRCQRFDLRRIDEETLKVHFRAIADRENAHIADGALGLIARAADGSVRDGLSLLDQAISHIGGEISGEVDEAQVRAMLGLADRTMTFDLIEAALRGDAVRALAVLSQQHESGADAAQSVEDALGVIHWLTRVKLAPEVADDAAVPEIERKRGRAMAGALAMPALARAWQILLKGLSETRAAPNAAAAAEMVLVRLAYTSTLPSPEEAVRALQANPPPAPTPPPSRGATPSMTPSMTSGGGRPMAALQSAPRPDSPPPARDEIHPVVAQAPRTSAPPTFADVIDLVTQRKEGRLRGHLLRDVHLVRFEPGRIEFRAGEHAPDDLAKQLSGFLNRETGRTWLVGLSSAAGGQTVADQQAAARAALRASVTDHPFVRAVLETFPGAKIEDVRRPQINEPIDEPAPESTNESTDESAGEDS